MGSDGSRGPRPYAQRSARTLFVRVPAADWPLVKRGIKREFRGQIGRQSALFAVATPTPAVAYSIVRGNHDARLMILEKCWQEELGAISDESLGYEGFGTMAEFRRYWIQRERNGKGFKPTRQVFVYRLSPYSDTRREELADVLLERLYGEWL